MSSDTAKELLAGSVGGIVQVLSGQPFDTVKVRLQTSAEFSGVSDCVRKTYANEGFFGFYKGTLTPLIGIGACVSIQFAALEYAKRGLNQHNANQNNNHTSLLSIPQLFLAGAFSGICNSVLSGPIEHIRTRLQVDTKGSSSKGPLDLIQKIVTKHGISGLYKGQAITMQREFFGYGVYFAVYEALIAREIQSKKVKRSQISPFKQILYGALAGYTLWFAVYPIDFIKSKLQTDALVKADQKYSSTLDVVRQTFKQQGIKGFYKGFVPCILRAAPINGLTFAAFEISMNQLGR